MSRNPHTAFEDATLEEVVTIMERHRVKRVPVVRGGKLVGIITRVNLLEAVARVARTMPQVVQDDAVIRDCILEQLAKQPWHTVSIGVTVRGGKADLSGAILDERLREALKVLVENVPGVTEIHDHLVWVEPCSGMAFPSSEDKQAERQIPG